MSNTMMLYWFTRLDEIKGFLAVMIILNIIFLIGCGFFYLISSAEDIMTPKTKKKLVITVVINAVLFMFFYVSSVFIPTTKEIAFIYLGGKLADYGSNNEDLKQIPDKAIKLLNNKMEQYLEEQKKEIDKIKEGK